WAWIRRRRGFLDRQGEEEGAALVQHRFDPDATAVALDDLLADAQAETCPRILRARVHATFLTNFLEEFFQVVRLDADAIVPHSEQPRPVLRLGADVDPDRPVAAEFEGIVDEVLQDAE